MPPLHYESAKYRTKNCFHFESRGKEEPEEPPCGRNYSDIPVGLAAIRSSSGRLSYFYVEPTVNWLGVVY